VEDDLLGDDGRSPFEVLQSTLVRRTNCAARRLVEPGPSPAQVLELMALAAAAPDHGQLTPWRFVLVPAHARARLGDAFVAALLQRDPSATLEQLECAREKAFHAPVLLLAIAVDKAPIAGISAGERLISLGAAIQNVLLGATARGWGTALASGQAMDADALRTLFQLSDQEAAICFIALGTLHKSKHRSSPRPGVERYFTQLDGEPVC
jgi:nitroreductase